MKTETYTNSEGQQAYIIYWIDGGSLTINGYNYTDSYKNAGYDGSIWVEIFKIECLGIELV